MAELSYKIRPAVEEDLHVLMDLLKQLVLYSKLPDSYTAT